MDSSLISALRGRLAPFLVFTLAAAVSGTARGDVKLPAIFTNHLVFQRDLANPVWGWASPGEEVTVSIGGQKHMTKADDQGKWRVKLDPMATNATPQQMIVEGKNKLTVDDILVGEVWVCSGQSNMQWSVMQANDPDLETKTANLPLLRLITVPNVGTQEPQSDFKGEWMVCSPQTVGDFSAVGYFFGRQLQQTLNIPIGLIDNAWGGSACEAWIRRELLEKDSKYAPLIERWVKIEKEYDHEKALAKYQVELAKYKEAAEAAKNGGKPAPQLPRQPGNLLTGNARPANIYNGALKPTIGYGIRGAIWYQGESNAGRAYQYRDMFPLMIQSWRDEWGQGEFPFYWVQLADFMAEKSEPSDSAWAELREAQTLTMSKLKNTGEAVIIDIGEGKDIHPKNKQDVSKRLARWALAKDYGIDIAHSSPLYNSMAVSDGKAIITFKNVGGGLRTFDVADPVGFAIAGNDKKFVWAKSKLVGPDRVEVWSDEIKDPVSVRYGWGDNPKVNLYSKEGLPATPFRTDDWPGVTAEAK